ncbi:uracil-DNA glycosylase [Actinomycetospora cinnamomea]|uniref:Type-5 uracil-DNA glycosylase n=1 Tax=Actinomycetospora cinnamomea TaxID=663609 RepID=A0A2U1FS76_9PSEU|nr:uracil-DNA glycosylase [Actinomycetospora cinnamomea]PVZ15019.1 uracil-DNA glycosylase family 4 [Actinomycetospora cinnamomea]
MGAAPGRACDPPRSLAPGALTDPRGRRLADLAARIADCEACPRLVAARREAEPAATSWARPVPGFGDPDATVHVLGLATAPHGGNRTGRAFTGNRTADVLVAALHRTGLANQPTSRHVDDGLRLHGAWMSSAVRCPPPDHRPTPQERDTCLRWLSEEVDALGRVRVLVCLGGFAWDAAATWAGVRPRPRFGHGAEHVVAAGPREGLALLGCYHPGPQNTATGRLTPSMLDAVLHRARELGARR